MKFEIVMSVLPLVFVALVFQFTPLLTRQGIYFSATVPSDFPRSAEGRRLLRSYRLQVALWSVGAILLAASLTPQNPLLGSMAPLFFLIAGVGFTYWRKFREVHTNYGVARPEIRQANLSSPPPGESFDLRLLLPPFLALGPVAAYLRLHWSQILESFPVHWGPNGQPNRWSGRDWYGVYGPLLIGAATNLFILALAWLIARESRQSMMRYITVRSVQFLLYPLTFTFAVVSLLPLLQLQASQVPVLMLAIVLFTFLAVAALLFWSYRKLNAPSAEQEVVREPQGDRYWKGGLFYYNPNDPAILVAKRVGIGYTLNFANKLCWLILAGILLLALIPALLGLLASS
jgi:uncharacterized membrane protein